MATEIHRRNPGNMYVPLQQLEQFIDKPMQSSDWVRVDQHMINAFADATMDHQFIHVDEERAARTPFGATIAHGYLTMSLIAHFSRQCAVRPDNAAMVINYGSDRMRFLKPVKVDSDIRANARLVSVREKKPGQILTKTRIAIEIKGEGTPAMIADILTLFVME